MFFTKTTVMTNKKSRSFKLNDLFKKVDGIYESVGEVMNEAFSSIGEELADSNSITTEDLTVIVKGKEVIINGDLKSLKVNGKQIEGFE